MPEDLFKIANPDTRLPTSLGHEILPIVQFTMQIIRSGNERHEAAVSNVIQQLPGIFLTPTEVISNLSQLFLEQSKLPDKHQQA